MSKITVLSHIFPVLLQCEVSATLELGPNFQEVSNAVQSLQLKVSLVLRHSSMENTYATQKKSMQTGVCIEAYKRLFKIVLAILLRECCSPINEKKKSANILTSHALVLTLSFTLTLCLLNRQNILLQPTIKTCQRNHLGAHSFIEASKYTLDPKHETILNKDMPLRFPQPFSFFTSSSHRLTQSFV